MKRILTILFTFCFLFSVASAHPLVSEARNHIGKPYRYSATGPNAFDCSGFVYYCVEHSLGIVLKRTACDQGYDDTYPKINTIKQLRMGDLIYFNTIRDKDMCDHTGIYLGNNKFIHCSSAKGEVVVSELVGTYYEPNFSWGRRLIE